MDNNCLHCGQVYVKKRANHKFCRKNCRSMFHNLKNGNKMTRQMIAQKAEPSRVEVLNPKLVASQKQKQQQQKQNLQSIQNPIHLINHYRQHLIYLQGELHNVQNGSYLLSTLSLGGAGLAVGGSDDENSGNNRFLAALIGGGIGLFLDGQRKKNAINELVNEINIVQDKLNKALRFQQLLEAAKLNAIPSQPVLNLPKGVVTAQQVSEMEFKTYDMSNSYWGYLWGGRPADPFYMIAYGLPSQGKSTLSIGFADYFNKNHGKVLFLASEQGIAQSLKGIINRTKSSELHIDGDPSSKTIEQHINDINNFNYKLVIIDSATHMRYGHEVLERMRKATPGTSYLVVLQSVKDGDFKGDNQWAHNCDIMININDGKAQVKKTRFMKLSNEWVDIPAL